ncbi:MAG: hypothetical protein KJP00_00550 [Bacteroidia bacterium]|nr:hypothetical protein [Bacteroidia bacterium]
MKYRFVYCFVFLIGLAINGNSQSNANVNPAIEGMSMAIVKVQPMLDFYSNIFNIKFEKRNGFDTTMYFAKWRGLKLLFVPIVLAGEQDAIVQNKHQFDIIVPDINTLISQVKRYGGTQTGALIDDGIQKTVHVKDPDGNTFIFKQNLRKRG